MILTFESCPTSPLGYLLGNVTSSGEQRQTPPLVISGDPETVEWLTVPGNGRKNRFLTGSISWSEDMSNISVPAIEQVCKELRTVLHAGFDPGDVPEPVFVLHTRKKGCDVHPIFPQVHLRTGRPISLVRFPHDAELFRTWRQRWNIRHGWTSPDDDAYWWLNDTAPEETRDIESWRTLDSGVKKLIRNGGIRKRSDTVAYFERCGVKVIAQYELGLIVELPAGEQVRFVGEKYSPGFDVTPFDLRVSAAREFGRKGAAAQLPSLDARFEELLKERASQNRRDYGNRPLDLWPMTKGARIRRAALAKRALREGHGVADDQTRPTGADVSNSAGESVREVRAVCNECSTTIQPEQFSGDYYEKHVRPIARFAGLLIRTVRRAANGLHALGGSIEGFTKLTATLHRGTEKLAGHARKLLIAPAGPRDQLAPADSCRAAGDGQGSECERGYNLCSIRRVANPPPELSIPLGELRRAAIANGRIRAASAGHRAAPLVVAQELPVKDRVVSVQPDPAPLIAAKIDPPGRSAKGDGSVSIEADDELMGR